MSFSGAAKSPFDFRILILMSAADCSARKRSFICRDVFRRLTLSRLASLGLFIGVAVIEFI